MFESLNEQDLKSALEYSHDLIQEQVFQINNLPTFSYEISNANRDTLDAINELHEQKRRENLKKEAAYSEIHSIKDNIENISEESKILNGQISELKSTVAHLKLELAEERIRSINDIQEERNKTKKEVEEERKRAEQAEKSNQRLSVGVAILCTLIGILLENVIR